MVGVDDTVVDLEDEDLGGLEVLELSLQIGLGDLFEFAVLGALGLGRGYDLGLVLARV